MNRLIRLVISLFTVAVLTVGLFFPVSAKPMNLPLSAPASDTFQWPWALGQSWQVTQGPHGENWSGLDINAQSISWDSSARQEIRAVAAGMARVISSCYIIIDHANGWSTGYVHIRASISSGPVSANDVIGIIETNKAAALCGGNSDGPHLHFRLFQNGITVPIEGTTFGGWTVGVTPGYYQNPNLSSLYVKNGVTKKVYQPLDNTMIPNSPSNLQITYTTQITNSVSFTFANLSWTDNSSSETQFYINDVTNKTAFNTPPNVTSWQYTWPVTNSAIYCFTVSAVNSAGFSAPSNQACTGAPTPTPIPPIIDPNKVFNGGSSRLYQSGNWLRADLQVCANNLKGKTVYVDFRRPDGNGWKVFKVNPKTATSNCVTFTDMDGSGPLNRNTTYYSRVALNQQPDSNWPIPCAGPTSGQGLCDKIYRP